MVSPGTKERLINACRKALVAMQGQGVEVESVAFRLAAALESENDADLLSACETALDVAKQKASPNALGWNLLVRQLEAAIREARH